MERQRSAPQTTAVTLAALITGAASGDVYGARPVSAIAQLLRPSMAITVSTSWRNSSTMAVEQPTAIVESVWADQIELDSPNFRPAQMGSFAARGFKRQNRR